MLPQDVFSQSTAKGARSTALHSLQWVLGMFLTALSASLFTKAPVWVSVALGISGALVLAVFLGAYVYLLLKQPDALRSEQFTLSKLAIEKGMVGDNVAGMHDPQVIHERRADLIAINADDADQDGRA